MAGLCIFFIILCIPLVGEIFYPYWLTCIMMYATDALAILSRHGISDACAGWPLIVSDSTRLALVVGSISPRSSGVYCLALHQKRHMARVVQLDSTQHALVLLS